jgi:hypothetical protein
MTRKDFQLIADVLKDHQFAFDVERIRLSAAFVLALQPTNTRFDGDRFMAATKKEVAQ